jgi:hypothetical protein
MADDDALTVTGEADLADRAHPWLFGVCAGLLDGG